jgi:hypothetical protein
MSTLILYKHSVFNNSYFKLQQIVNKGYSMNITAELSLYPLMANYVPTIQSYIQDLTYTVFCAEPAAVLVAKYVNRDRRDESQT